MGDSLRDSFASRGFGLVENCLIIKEEYRQRVEAKVLEIVETHPTIAAIRNGEAVTDLQLVPRQAEHLFQTLLHRAFRGELAPQDTNDEPASVLLDY